MFFLISVMPLSLEKEGLGLVILQVHLQFLLAEDLASLKLLDQILRKLVLILPVLFLTVYLEVIFYQFSLGKK